MLAMWGVDAKRKCPAEAKEAHAAGPTANAAACVRHRRMDLCSMRHVGLIALLIALGATGMLPDCE